MYGNLFVRSGQVDGKPVEGTWRSHQVPLAELFERPDHLRLLEQWMLSYRPRELFDDRGRLRPELEELAPRGERRMSEASDRTQLSVRDVVASYGEASL